MKTNFQNKNFALRLALKRRQTGTRKWPILILLSSEKSLGWTTWSSWTPCDNKCYRKRERFCYHSGNVKSCGGNVNAYGIEYHRVKCPSSICPGTLFILFNSTCCLKQCHFPLRLLLSYCIMCVFNATQGDFMGYSVSFNF